VPIRHATDSDYDLRDALGALVDLAEADLPVAAGVAEEARRSEDLAVVHAMVRRVYAMALEAEHCYAAELADIVLRELESTTTLGDGPFTYDRS
jgi:hypothetical protein